MMALQVMIVVEGPGYPYQFGAKIQPTESKETSKTVNILMPIGGKETGLFRYPKVGERVVVDNDGATSPTYYLMGYLPSATDANNNFLSNTNELWVEPSASEQKAFTKQQKEAYEEACKEHKTKVDNFNAEKDALEDAEALVLRYEQTGKNTPEDGKDERYSEIGFYRKQTSWRTNSVKYRDILPDRNPPNETDATYSARLVVEGYPKEGDETAAAHIQRLKNAGSHYVLPVPADNETDAAYSARLVAAGYPKEPKDETDADHIKRIKDAASVVFPRIDRLNIQSSGDMRASAKNYQLLRSKRFELLVDTDTIHTEEELSEDDLPLGDNPGDDPVLHAGDAHIRAGNRVVIKAGSEIILQVGKSVITINDKTGIELKSKLVNSNLTNAYDTVLNLSPQNASLYGRNVKINADISLGLGDTFGGSFSTRLGVVSIGGREISIGSYDWVKYMMLEINAVAQYIQAVTAGSMAVKGEAKDSKMVMAYVKFITDVLNHGVQLAEKLIDVVRTWRKWWAMTAAERQEKVATKAEEKTKLAKDKLNKAIAKEEQAKSAKTDAESNATEKETAYETKKQAWERATGTEKETRRTEMEAAYKEMTMAKAALKEKEEKHKDCVDDVNIAQGNYKRAEAKSTEERTSAVNAWNTEITKKVPQPANPPAPPANPPAPPTNPSAPPSNP
jgi:hypothetical protein